MSTEIEFTSDLRVDLIDHMGNDLTVARAAWVSTKGQRARDEADTSKVAGLINYLMAHRHGTPFEHNSLTFFVDAPIAVWREWQRHRIGISYNEQSGRYSQLAPKFYIPARDRAMVNTGTSARPRMEAASDSQYQIMEEALKSNSKQAYLRYETMLGAGIAKEVARFVLPVNIYSACYVTCNARSLMHFLGLRTHSEDATFVSFPQREIEICAEQVEAHFATLYPLIHAAFQKNGRVAP